MASLGHNELEACEQRSVNALRWKHNGHNLADDIFKRTFLEEKFLISIKFSLQIAPKDPIDHNSILIRVMVWWRQATKYWLKQCWPNSMSPYGHNELTISTQCGMMTPYCVLYIYIYIYHRWFICPLFGAKQLTGPKQLPGPMMVYFLSNPWEETSVNLNQNTNPRVFFSRKCISKCRL